MPGGSNLYRYIPQAGEQVLLLQHISGSRHATSARDLASGETWASWDACERALGLTGGILDYTFWR
ncbi:MAG TPA: hypothetical protein PK406_00805 [Verrucomicrobiota bacterium]|nr:hypothetical protein [Verrucomicrobiota bacterium]